jgi:curli biogenesis system outer membrane secretion channel CsgG
MIIMIEGIIPISQSLGIRGKIMACMKRVAQGSALLLLYLPLLAGCATVAPPPAQIDSAVRPALQRQAQTSTLDEPVTKRLKLKIAIGRFSNETRYGRTFVTDATGDPLGKQASDMLSARLVESGSFLVFERPDVDKIRQEQALIGQSNLIGVDTFILGSVTEFGRSTTGEVGFLSATKRQTARAKVEIRLADARTGQVFFSAAGAGEAVSEAGEVAGFGSRASYDGSLNDKAIGAAISDVMNALVTKLRERAWRADILKMQGPSIIISGGSRQGLKIGDELVVMRSGGSVRSPQSGFTIDLPPTQVATLRVRQVFGESETNEGSIADIVSGSLAAAKADGLFVTEPAGAR